MRDLSYLKEFYDSREEDPRLLTRHGTVEFTVTMHYIEKYLKPGMRVLEIGAGTGRYAHTLARRSFAVDAVELVEANIEVFRANTEAGENISIRQGDALDLADFADEAYDITLLLGPMYHLYEDAQKAQALREALRVTKPGGVLFTAYCIAELAILQHGFLRGNLSALMEKGLLHPETFEASSTPAEVFELCRREDIDRLNAQFPVQRLHYVATDLFSEMLEEQLSALDEESFAMYLKYQLFLCERPDVTGMTGHSLDVVRKAGAL